MFFVDCRVIGYTNKCMDKSYKAKNEIKILEKYTDKHVNKFLIDSDRRLCSH